MTGSLFGQTHPNCEGCPILQKTLPRHCVIEDEFEDPCDILFVSDSPKMFEGEYVAFRAQEFAVIMNQLNKLELPDDITVGFTYAAKCPNMNMDVMPAPARKRCYEHLANTIDHYKPTLVISCGALSTNIFHRKVKDAGKARGKLLDMQMGDDRHKFKFVATIHPWQVVSEPKNEYLFNKDLFNNISEVILGVKNKKTVPYDPVLSMEDYNKICDDSWFTTTNPVAVDIETTGLDFLHDTIHTISFTELDATGEPTRTVAMPINHKDFDNKVVKEAISDFVTKVLKNKNNRKVFQNAIFDLRFLKRAGFNVVNVWDTKLLQHFVYEEVPKSLSDLVYYYFNEEI